MTSISKKQAQTILRQAKKIRGKFLRLNSLKPRWMKKFWWLIIFSLLIVSIGLLIFAVIRKNGQTDNSINGNTDSANKAPISIENEIINRERNQIEAAYPEFKDFEHQKSFAGQEVSYLIDGDDHYFAFLVRGSGVPIAHATCFRVDHLMRVYKIGEFPDPLDSYAGYQNVNPKNCVGIK